jgi:hypothetical protein
MDIRSAIKSASSMSQQSVVAAPNLCATVHALSTPLHCVDLRQRHK